MTDVFYVTTPIYYVNDRPHLGHVYTTTVADVVARYHRLKGDDTFFLTGVDEHAAKVADKARDMGLSPQAWADRNAAQFREVFERLEMTHDDFVRTSEDRHKARVVEYFKALLASGDVYAGEYEGWYDAGQEEYVPEAKARANQYKSEVNEKPLIRKKEKNYFFRLSRYRDALQDHFARHPEFVQPDARRNEIVNRIKEAEDVPISRTGAGGWGIPVPDDPEQTIYVWIDALCNYLTYIDTPDRRKYWRAGAVHLIAKDILWFHAAIWPAMLMALRKCPGYEWVTLPRRVYCHSYWVSESGQKMSKSLGNFLDPEAIDNYVGEFGLDALRYFLATRGPLGAADATFSPDLFLEVYNADLANTVGNCFSRVANMTQKYFDGRIPASDAEPSELRAAAAYSTKLFSQRFPQLALHDATANGPIGLTAAIDQYIERTQPFKLAKDESKRGELGTILYNCAEALRIASLLLWPFLPGKMEELWRRMHLDYAEQIKSNDGRGRLAEWVRWGQLLPGTPIEKGEPLFPRKQA